jgi:hypothetical protein
VLKRIFGPKMDEVACGWRGLHCTVLFVLFAKYNQNDRAKEDETSRSSSTNGEGRRGIAYWLESQKEGDY